jgi:hypothetical protein
LKDPVLLQKYRVQGRRHVEQTLTHATVARELGEKLHTNILSKS